MKIGYGRTSTIDQVAGLDAQLRDLKEAGCEKVFSEQISSKASRRELEAALEYCREGDTLVVTKLDRLARSISDLVKIRERLETKGVALVVLALNLDTSTPTGKLMVNLLGSIAEFERELMLERQREGITSAKAAGRYKGRVPTAQRQAEKIIALKAQGYTVPQIVRETGVGRSSVFNILKEINNG